jgi:hypothetical protein
MCHVLQEDLVHDTTVHGGTTKRICGGLPCHKQGTSISILQAIGSGQLRPQLSLKFGAQPDFVDPVTRLATAIMQASILVPKPDMTGRCFGCGDTCSSQSSCKTLRSMNQLACDKRFCQACLLPLSSVGGINVHPSMPGWKRCEFKYVEQVRKMLVLASLKVDIKVTLPDGFPTTGPLAAAEWAFSSSAAGQPPNIIFFVAALLKIQV